MLEHKCKKCLEAENIPLTDLLFYILKILDPYRYKSSHLTMQVSTITQRPRPDLNERFLPRPKTTTA